MKKILLVSFDTYSWVKYVSGLILSSPDDIFELIIISKDNTLPERAKFLAPEAIEAQRNYDLRRINNKLNIKKLSKLEFSYGDILHNKKRFDATLGVGLLLATPSEIIFQNEPMLRNIIPKLSRTTPVFAYGSGKTFPKRKLVHLNKDNIEKKLSLSKLITASGDMSRDTHYFPVVEQLYYR